MFRKFLHPLLGYVVKNIEEEFSGRIGETPYEDIFPHRAVVKIGNCRIDVMLPPVGSNYIIEVGVYDYECIETAVRVAKSIEKRLNKLFGSKNVFSKIKKLGIGFSPAGFNFYLDTLERSNTGNEGTKTKPLEILIRIGLYTKVKISTPPGTLMICNRNIENEY